MVIYIYSFIAPIRAFDNTIQVCLSLADLNSKMYFIFIAPDPSSFSNVLLSVLEPVHSP